MAQFGTLLECFGLTFDDLFLPFDGIIERLDLVYFGISFSLFFLYGLNLGTNLHVFSSKPGISGQLLGIP